MRQWAGMGSIECLIEKCPGFGLLCNYTCLLCFSFNFAFLLLSNVEELLTQLYQGQEIAKVHSWNVESPMFRAKLTYFRNFSGINYSSLTPKRCISVECLKSNSFGCSDLGISSILVFSSCASFALCTKPLDQNHHLVEQPDRKYIH